MSRIAAICGAVLNSPTWLRDRATLVSGFTVGSTALLVNGAIFLMIAVAITEASTFRLLLQRLDFGEVAAIGLLFVLVMVLTLSIPLRFVGLFMGPRIFRYFDQVVLSGISPMRYVIGRVVSQNLYFLLILFLLIPWIVLVVLLGGLSWPMFIGNMFLVWLYCMMLSMVMAWLTVYMPEWMAAGLLIGLGIICCLLAFAPIPGQPIVVTPTQALLQPLISSDFFFDQDLWIRSYGSVFLSSVILMSLIFAGTLLGVYLGPLFGLIRENSTFGEVVYAGDSRLKRRLRFRQHVQRPSELAFLYQNRGGWLLRFEGLLRWLANFTVIGTLAMSGWLVHYGGFKPIITSGFSVPNRLISAYFITAQFVHGTTLALAIILYSQGRSTTFQQLSVMPGRKLRVSQLDWAGFACVMVLSTAVTLIQGAVGLDGFMSSTVNAGSEGSVIVTESVSSASSGAAQFQPDFPEVPVQSVSQAVPRLLLGSNTHQLYLDTTIITSACGVTLYLLQRLSCLACWQKTLAAAISGSFWFFALSFAPMVAGLFIDNVGIDALWGLPDWGESLAMLSPFVAWMQRLQQAPNSFSTDHSLAGFLFFQLICWLGFGWLLLRRSRRLLAETGLFQSGAERS